MTFGFIWWAATITAQLSALTAVVEAGTNDRYRGTQAIQDFKLRDQKDAFLQEQINQIKDALKEHKRQPWHDEAGLKLQEFKGHTHK